MSMVASTPAGTIAVPPGYVLTPRRNWKAIAGALKMMALTLQGIGIIIAGLSIGYLTSVFNGLFLGPPPLTSFLNTLEAGIILVGLGAIVLGVAYFVESLA